MVTGYLFRKFVLSAAFLLALILSAAATPLQLVTLQYPPYEYQDGDKVDGIVVRLLHHAFEKLGRDIEITVLPWKRAQLMAKKGQVDGIFTVYETPERLKYLDYSKKVLIPQTVSLWALRETEVAYDGTMESLADVSIGLVLGVSYGEKADRALKSGALKHLEYAPDSAQNIKKLLAGRTSVVIMNRYGALHHLHLQDGFERVKELTPEISSVPSYVAFSKLRNHTALRDQFDQVLETMIASGDYARIIDDYFAEKSAKTEF
ncbi:amino acid ABC transporter substrate-binding protein [Labrenzia sp. R4_1]|uniref:substrate-binding periplasmic protein n=1 Tax=Labrenzia sp. R4_1 TaxID=2821106 RepID=UPI001ADCC56E|nr:transporter substrate-binding domain-containing protein [Labrenzia sp. R4_1]MBO9426424.1 amino acid ABC transporter substrate-binding protein [Labrenzia sp. R4_1]